MIAWDVYVALAVVFAKAPLDPWKWQVHFGFTANSYDQMRKSIRIIGQIFYTTKHCEFTKHRIHFRFWIQNLLRLDQIGTISIRIHALHLLKEDETNSVTK